MQEDDLSWCFDIIVGIVLAGADQEETSGIDYMGGPEGLVVAASVLPILLDFAEIEEEKLAVKKIIVTALTHPNRTVRRQAASGVREYLWTRDAAFAQQCVMGNIVYAKQEMELYQKTFSETYLNEPSDAAATEFASFASWINDIRDRLCHDSFSVNIDEITFHSHSSDQLFVTSLMIPYGSDDSIHIAIMKKMLLLLIQAEKNEDDNDDEKNEIEVDYQLPFDFAQYFVRFLANLPKEKTHVYLDELWVGCKLAPSLITSILINLDYLTELSEEKDLFWNIWNGLAPKVQEIAVEIAENYNHRSGINDRRKLIRTMLYADTPWQKVDYQKLDIQYGAVYLIEFTKKAGINPDVFEAMASLMYHFPNLFFTKGLLVLAGIHSYSVKTNLTYNRNSVFYLEKSIHRYLMVDHMGPLTRTEHRACLILLNELVEMASSEAYYLRENLIHSRRIMD